jgi:type IV pilus assembly protein PilY1
MTSANTSSWTSVTTDGFGINTKDLLGSSVSNTNLAAQFPDLRWCDTNGQLRLQHRDLYVSERLPLQPRSIYSNPYYYTINVAEYCTDDSLTTCQVTAVGAPAPPATRSRPRYAGATARR